MNKEELIQLKTEISKLSDKEKIERDLFLSKLSRGEVDGKLTGIPSIDKPWLQYYDEESIKTEMPKMTCYEYLYKCNEKYMNRVALSYFGRKIKFDEFFTHIDTVTYSLIKLGLKEGDIITISLPNIPEAAYLFYACSKLGVIANMVDPRTSSEGIEKYIKEVDSKKVIIIDSYYDKVKPLLNNRTIDKVVAVSPACSLPFGLTVGYKVKEIVDNMKKESSKIVFDDNTISWSDFYSYGKNYFNVLDGGSAERLGCQYWPDYKENRPVVIEHTGGTTGVPKGVVLSNENINAVALQSVLTGIDMQREHNWLDIMPTFIAYGVAMGLHLPLTIGMETILIPQFDPKKFDELLIKNKPIHMVGVPSYWGTIINSKKLKNKDLSYIIAPTVGGDAMDTTLEKESNEFLKKHNCSSLITKGYGMTEVSGGITGTLVSNNEIGSVGSPFVKSNVAIFDPDTNEELGYNQHGEVCMTGPNIMLGYYNNEEATNNILKKHEDGTYWIHSGDVGYINEKGSLFIVDRLKRMIIRYDGFKVFPSIIENVISTHKAVEACKVVGINDMEHSQGKLPKAHIVLKEEYKSIQDEVMNQIKKMCFEQLPEYAQPVDYKFRDELPFTPIGKVDYRKLEEEDINEKRLKKEL